VVVVATIRALKMHGGVAKSDLHVENVAALDKGFANLEKQVENIRTFGVPVVVALNKFHTDTEQEIDSVLTKCGELGITASLCEVWEKGGEGGVDLANKVVEATGQKNDFRFLYDEKESIPEKIRKIASEIYGARGVTYTDKAQKEIERLENLGLDKYPICMAKTQYSLSDNPDLLGRPEDFEITIREVRVSAGAEFIVALTGNVLVMPGLPKVPSAEKMDIDAAGVITGLF
jgi:formate--tetrahydrofolate ligase